ncbi:MAG: zinc-dependent metalloprotease [Planctomycetota bacterium]
MRSIALAVLFVLASCKSPAKPAPVSAPNVLPAIASKITGKPSQKGLFTIYGEPSSSLWELPKDALSKTYLWSPHITGGLGTYALTGQGGNDRAVRFERKDNQLLVRQVQTVFTMDPGRPERLGLNDNYRMPVILSLPILAETDGALLISGEKFIKSFNWDIVSGMEQELKGQRSPDSLRIQSFEVCPENMEWDFEIDLDLKPDSSLPAATPMPDPRRVTVGLHWSLRTLPESDYKPRRADPLVGYFTTTTKNLSRPEELITSENRIVRWDIRRKNPDIFTTGDVAKPVVYWISNNTPHEFRDTIRDAVLEWNKAFEAAGFRGALDCKVQPDDATWSLSDCRYNVIQWITSHKLFFSGHGPVTENPFTGEILRAHIRIDGESLHGLNTSPALLGSSQCQIQAECDCLPALAMLVAPEAGTPASREITLQYLKRVVIHEVGHTLGLRHNFKGSTALPAGRSHDKAYTAEYGLSSSIMDYAHTNLHPDSGKQGHFFSQTIGAYDYWAVRYGYAHDPGKPEEELLASILKHPKPYATDEDANHDPYTALYDATDEPLADAARQQEALERCLMRLADRAVLADVDPGIRRHVFKGLVRRWYLYPKSHARFLGGQVYLKGHVPKGSRLMQWIEPAVEKAALASIVAPLSGIKQDQWAVILDDLPRLTLPDWNHRDEPMIAAFRQEMDTHHRDLIYGTLHPMVFNRLHERSLRSKDAPGLTQDGFIEAFWTAAIDPKSAEHWRRINVTHMVRRLIQLDGDPSLNVDGQALVHARLVALLEGPLHGGPLVVGESAESKAVQERLTWEIRRHLEPSRK